MTEEQTLAQAVFQRVRDERGDTFWLLKETVNYYWNGDPEVTEDAMAEVFDDLRRRGVDVMLFYEELEIVPESDLDFEPAPPPESGPRGRFGGRSRPPRGGNPFHSV